MILEHKIIELYGKMLFEKVVLAPPFKKPNPMPNEACFLYIKDGEYTSVSEKEQLRLRTHESVLMKCGSYLSEMYTSGKSQKYEAIAVHFYPDVLQKVYDHEIPSFLKPQNSAPNLSMGKLNSDILIHKYIESILFYFDNQQLVNDEILTLKLKEIILLLNQTKNAPNIRNILSNLFNPTTYTFREIIEAHLYSNITTTELAQLTDRSLSSFKREFEKIYHTTPAAYIKDKKLEKAARHLKSSELRTSNIAYDCGFSDIAHFSKSFKQKYGVSPSVYRVNQIDKSMDQ